MSAPTLVARTTSRPPTLIVAPVTASPGATSTGTRLAGEQRRVDRRAPLLDDAVGGDLLAGADDEPVADRELVDRHAPLGAVVVEHGDVLGAELEQRLSAAPARRLARASK